MSEKDDSACVACPAGSSSRCNKGEYFSAECTCKRCAKQPSNCSSEEYYNGCSGTGVEDDGVCSTSVFKCQLDACNGLDNYYIKMCNAKTGDDNFCGPCLYTDGNVPPGFFLSKPCSLSAPSEIQRCTQTNASR
jgi:hypothetical protein